MIKRISASSLPAGDIVSKQIAYAKEMERAVVDVYHFDVMDGSLVTNVAGSVNAVAAVKQNTTLLIEAHLMCHNPTKLIKAYADAGVRIITLSLEAFKSTRQLVSALKSIRKQDLEAGLSIDLATPVEYIIPFLSHLDFVTVMSVKAGTGGQDFDPKALDKIKRIREVNDHIFVQVDGGINDKNAPSVYAAGADMVAVGSYIYSAANRAAAVSSIVGK